MIETKTLYWLLAAIGVPAFIYTWFTQLGDIVSTFDLTKTIILAAIAIGLGLFALVRSAIKTIYAVWEFWDKLKTRKLFKKK